MELLLAVRDIDVIKDHIFRDQLINEINKLINEDFASLIQILYRIDINERHLKTLLSNNKTTDAAETIADQIIERQLQKIKTRQQFCKPESGISEEDKW